MFYKLGYYVFGYEGVEVFSLDEILEYDSDDLDNELILLDEDFPTKEEAFLWAQSYDYARYIDSEMLIYEKFKVLITDENRADVMSAWNVILTQGTPEYGFYDEQYLYMVLQRLTR